MFPLKPLPSLQQQTPHSPFFLLFYSIYSNENINFAAWKAYLFLRHKKGYLDTDRLRLAPYGDTALFMLSVTKHHQGLIGFPYPGRE